MKAWKVWLGEGPWEEGCVLVFADSRNAARRLAQERGPWWLPEYIDLAARRVPKFDKHWPGEGPALFDSNEGLPERFFTSDDRMEPVD